MSGSITRVTSTSIYSEPVRIPVSVQGIESAREAIIQNGETQKHGSLFMPPAMVGPVCRVNGLPRYRGFYNLVG